MSKTLSLLIVMLLIVSPAFAGGVDPKDMPAPTPVIKEKVSATPAQTSAAVSKARKVVAPEIKEERMVTPQPKAAVTPKTVVTPGAAIPAPISVGSSVWMVGTGNGPCSPLSSVASKVNVGSFSSPKDLAQKLRQRGFQAFALDIGDQPDMVYKIRVPDKQLDLTFVRAGMCR